LEEGVSVSFQLQPGRSRAGSYFQEAYSYDFDLKGRIRHSFYSRLASENQTTLLETGEGRYGREVGRFICNNRHKRGQGRVVKYRRLMRIVTSMDLTVVAAFLNGEYFFRLGTRLFPAGDLGLKIGRATRVEIPGAFHDRPTRFFAVPEVEHALPSSRCQPM
jgi:hypothetical protein